MNGDSLKSEIAPKELDELGKNNRGSSAKQKHRSDSLFYATIPMVMHYEGGFVDDPIDRGGITNQAVNAVDEKWLKRELQKSRAEHCDAIVDRRPEQKRFIDGWFYRINDIGNKFGCDTIFKSRHSKK